MGLEQRVQGKEYHSLRPELGTVDSCEPCSVFKTLCKVHERLWEGENIITFAFYLRVISAVWEGKHWMPRAQLGAVAQKGDNGVLT